MEDEYFSPLSTVLSNGNQHLQRYFKQLEVDRVVYQAIFENRAFPQQSEQELTIINCLHNQFGDLFAATLEQLVHCLALDVQSQSVFHSFILARVIQLSC